MRAARNKIGGRQGEEIGYMNHSPFLTLKDLIISAAGSLSHNTRKLSRVGEEHT